MSSFDLASAMPTAVWVDDVSPSRLNDNPRHPHRYFYTMQVATIVVARIAGVEKPADGVATFAWWWVEHPNEGVASQPPLVTTAGFTSEVTFTPDRVGHHMLGCLRNDGSIVRFPFEVQ